MNKFHCLNISKRFNSNEELKESIINFFDKTMALYHLLDSDYRISYLKDNDIYKISYNNWHSTMRICWLPALQQRMGSKVRLVLQIGEMLGICGNIAEIGAE